MAFLSVRDINKSEETGVRVSNVSFTLAHLQKLAISGETGSGKTTLLKMISGLIQPDSGEVIFDGDRVAGPLEKLIPGHPKIAYLSQHFELRNNYRVIELLEMANQLDEHTANTIHEVCEIEHLLQRKTDQLSGGEKQRIALARLLTTSPTLLLLDEPFSNLDIQHKQQMKGLINRIGTRLGITSILVSHDPYDVLSWADKIIVMRNGTIIQQADPFTIYQQPVNEYCAGLFGEFNLVTRETHPTFGEWIDKHKGAQHLVIRPEHFSLTNEGNGMLDGIVQRILFWGNYFSLDVQVGLQLLRVTSGKIQYSVGDSVYLSVQQENCWPL